MTRSHRPAVIGIVGVSLLAVVGCATSPVPAPDIVTLLPYNGEWVLQAADREPVGLELASRDGYGFNTVAMRRVIAVLAVRAERFRMEVSDSVLRISSAEPGFSFAVPIDGTPVEVPDQDDEVQSLTLSWDGGTPVVRRTITSVGWVSDRFELTSDGALVLTRTAAVRNAGGRPVESSMPAFVYTRSTGS